MKAMKTTLAAAAMAVCVIGGAYATGFFPGMPFVGAPAYCASYNNGTCQQQVPAGPGVFAGTENTNMDVNAPGTFQQSGPATVGVNIGQLGQGPMVDQTTVATTQTIPTNTPWFFLDGTQGSALTVTMPATVVGSSTAAASPVEGQIQRVICEAATAGVLTVAASAGQTLKGNPNAACVAGVGYAWRWQASNATWYRFQ